MNQSRPSLPDSDAEMHDLDAHLLETARAFQYPPTPDLASHRREAKSARSVRRLVWVATLLCLGLCLLTAIPEIRAAVLNILHLGSVTIFTSQSTPTSAISAPRQTPHPTPTLLPSLLNLAGETTLEEARQKARFDIRLPTYPLDLGAPTHVFMQGLGGQAVISVWADGASPGGVRLSLHALTQGAVAYKMDPKVIEEVTVNGHRAIWTEGPYLIEVAVRNQAEWMERRLIPSGHVLIWADGTLTYRLETALPLEEAIKIAESLK